MTTVCDESNLMPLGAGYLCEDGIELAVADVGYWTITIDGIAIYGAQRINVAEIVVAIEFQPREIVLQTVVSRAMPSIINNDVVTPLNKRVIDEAVKRVDNVRAGRYQETVRGIVSSITHPKHSPVKG